MTSINKTLLLLGGTSDIGRAIAVSYAAAGWKVILAARDHANCERNARDIAARYDVQVQVVDFNVCVSASFKSFIEDLPVLPDTVVLAVGLLGEQLRAEVEPVHASEILRTNFEGPALLLGLIANQMAERGSGTIVGISSVAGERGRSSNYIYGSAKAGFTAFLSGLRSRLTKRGVRVLTVIPGFVRTKMTDGLSLPSLLTDNPDAVGRAVYRAAEISGKDVIYVPSIWRWVMAIIRSIPEFAFKKMSI